MTLIAVLSADVHPVVLVDGLVTTANNEAAPPDTPLARGEARPGVDGMRPAGLVSKAVRIADGMHILCAGPLRHAWRVTNWARALVDGGQLYDQDAHERLVANSVSGAPGASFIVIQAREETLAIFTHGDIMSVKTQNFGSVLVGGAGREPFLTYLNSVQPMARTPPHANADDVHGLAAANALLLNLRVSQDYLAADSRMAAASTGGYFETVFPPALFGRRIPAQHQRWADAGTALVFIRVAETHWILERLVISSRIGGRHVVTSTTGPIAMPDGTAWRIPAANLQHLELGVTHTDTVNVSLPTGFRVPIELLAVSAQAGCPTCTTAWYARGAQPVQGRVVGYATIDTQGLWLTPSALREAVLTQVERVYNTRCPRCSPAP